MNQRYLIAGLVALFFVSELEAEVCQGVQKADGSFVISLQNYEYVIPVISLGARVLRCEKFPKAENLWAAEIELGEAGTTSLRKETDLFIFSTKGGKIEKVFQKNIELEVSSADPTSGNLIVNKTKHGYQLQLTDSGAPQVRFDGADPITLPLKP